jgi:hypothetical protein
MRLDRVRTGRVVVVVVIISGGRKREKGKEVELEP